MTAQLDYAYRVSREAMLACLNTGFVDADGLRAMQAGMSNVAPHRHAFGSDRYDELRGAARRGGAASWCRSGMNPCSDTSIRQIPYPYRLGKMDPAWLFVLALVAGGFAFRPLWVIAGLIAFFRVVWSGHGFPMTTIILAALFSGGRRRW